MWRFRNNPRQKIVVTAITKLGTGMRSDPVPNSDCNDYLFNNICTMRSAVRPSQRSGRE